jgi:hypothetical protein
MLNGEKKVGSDLVMNGYKPVLRVIKGYELSTLYGAIIRLK